MILLSALPSLDGLWKFVVFIGMLSVLIVLHEAGHFIVARKNGVRVDDFAVGFGPTLLKWTSPRSGTNYRINVFLIGGYCAMRGEDGVSSEAEQQREFQEHALDGRTRTLAEPPPAANDNFQGKPPLARLAIILAGPIANFILAFAIVVLCAMTFGIPSDTFNTTIGSVTPGSPGARAGLAFGDRVVSIDGVALRDGEQLFTTIRRSAGKPLDLRVDRRGTLRDILVTPERRTEGGKSFGVIGFNRVSIYKRVGLIEALHTGAVAIPMQFVGTLQGLAALATHPAQNASNVQGVIGMERAASQVQELGWGPYLLLAAAISMALGVFNLLPIPALDGGRALFILAEMVRGRPVAPEKEALVHATGFALLMVFMVAVAYHDIANIVAGKGALQ